MMTGRSAAAAAATARAPRVAAALDPTGPLAAATPRRATRADTPADADAAAVVPTVPAIANADIVVVHRSLGSGRASVRRAACNARGTRQVSRRDGDSLERRCLLRGPFSKMSMGIHLAYFSTQLDDVIQGGDDTTLLASVRARRRDCFFFKPACRVSMVV